MSASNEEEIPFRLRKRCRVCGDKALAFHYNGLSCESCKAFFRRNALRQEELICNQGGHCTIEIATRKFCQACRLSKCFAIGMKKKLIPSKEETSLSKANNNTNTPTGPEDLINPTGNCGSSAPKSTNQSMALSPYEVACIDEINQASAIFNDERKIELQHVEIETLVQALNLTAFYVRKVIGFAKCFEAFRALSNDDQLVVIKKFFSAKLILRSAFNYYWQIDATPLIDNDAGDHAVLVRLSLLGELWPPNIVSRYRHLLHNINLELEKDVNLKNIIGVILMFRYDKIVSCPEFMRYHYHFFSNILKRYLQNKYQDCGRALHKFKRCVHLLDTIREVKEILVSTFHKIDANQLNHLAVEIYNLK